MPEKLNLDAIVEAVVSVTDTSKKQARNIIANAFAFISAEVSSGNEVRIAEFGTFKTKVRSARKGRNPLTGESLDIPESIALGFKPVKHGKK